MAGLADDAALDPAPELTQELVGDAGLEAQAWRHLDQKRAELGPEATYL